MGSGDAATSTHPSTVVPCCYHGGRSGEGNDHDDAVFIGVAVVGVRVVAVLLWGLLRVMSWRSSRKNGAGE